MTRAAWGFALGFSCFVLAGGFGGCATSDSAGSGGTAGAVGGSAGQASGGGGAAGAGSGGGGTGGVIIPDGGGDAGAGATGPAPDPKTCEEAKTTKSYVGCEFWPTVLANPVWDIFDFAVVVANSGDQEADVTVTRAGTQVGSTKVQPNGLGIIYLPWVAELKGPQADNCATGNPPVASNRVNDGAFHLVSTLPVTVWQFSSLEFQGQGGPTGKDWSTCPGSQGCAGNLGLPIGCFSFTNDASLLLPSTAMTGNYRVTSFPTWDAEKVPGYVGVTATQDGTTLKVKVSSTGQISGGGADIPATIGDGVLTLTLDAGDVVQLVAGINAGKDLSGSLVQADKPVQVIAGASCMNVPNNVNACDHIEESVLPAETLGKHYFVARPTGPGGQPVGHAVRLYGNVDGTQLQYPSGTPINAPVALNAGQVWDMGIVKEDFEILSDKEFAVGTFQQGGAAVDPAAPIGTRKGDPSQSQATALEQWRDKYIFIAPNDFSVSYVDIIQPMDAKVIIDGSFGVAPVKIGTSDFGVARVKLSGGAGGVHLVLADKPFGIQVMGYAAYTSYQYPGGLALEAIAPSPPPIK